MEFSQQVWLFVKSANSFPDNLALSAIIWPRSWNGGDWHSGFLFFPTDFFLTPIYFILVETTIPFSDQSLIKTSILEHTFCFIERGLKMNFQRLFHRCPLNFPAMQCNACSESMTVTQQDRLRGFTPYWRTHIFMKTKKYQLWKKIPNYFYLPPN